MMDKYCKCNFCKSYDTYDGCEWGCSDYEDYSPEKDRIREFAKEEGLSIADAISLINM